VEGSDQGPRLGVYLSTYAPAGDIDTADVLHAAVEAEAFGFDHVWVGDHFVWNTGMLAPLPTLAAIASVTTRIRLGTGVYLLNLRHPMVTAKDVATVDMLSNGRVILGVGLGGDDPAEYLAVGVDPERRGKRFQESLDALRPLLRGEIAYVEGELLRVPSVRLDPAPRNDVPIWVGGRSEISLERAAASCDGWFPLWVSPGRIRSAVERVREVRGSTQGFAFGLNIFTTVAPTRALAASAAAHHLSKSYALPFEKFERYAAYGTSEDVVKCLSAYIDAGVTDFALNIAGPDMRSQLAELGAKVLPALT
jgi:probable F420-dependent oxidoreductase